MSENYLDPLLCPRRIVLVGISESEASPGATLAAIVPGSNFAGEVYPINSRGSAGGPAGAGRPHRRPVAVAWELRAQIDSIDVNPVIAAADGAFAVEALVTVGK